MLFFQWFSPQFLSWALLKFDVRISSDIVNTTEYGRGSFTTGLPGTRNYHVVDKYSFTALFNNPTYNSFKSFPCSNNTRLITLRLRMFLYLIKNILTIYKFWDNDNRVSLYVLSYRFTVRYRYSECCSHKNHNSVKLFSLSRKLT